MKIKSIKLDKSSAFIKKNLGFIYFMTERDLFGYPCGPYVKIGLVKGNDEGRSSFERRKEHQTGNPREIIIEQEIKTYASVSTLESLVHQRLSKYRIHGEWFNYGGKGISPYVEITKEINKELENNLENISLIDQLTLIEDNGEDIKPNSEVKDIHELLIKTKSEILKIKTKKDLATLKLKSFDKKYCKDIKGICFYEKSRPIEKFDKIKFQKDYPDIFEKIATEVINSSFNLKKDVKNKKSQEIKRLENIVLSQNFIDEDSSRLIDRNKEVIELHNFWLDSHVALQPLELKKKFYENKLKILVGENHGILGICSWKRKNKKQLNKKSLIEFNPDLAAKYISLGEPQLRFKINDYRPYHF